jgi:purine-binding chemotaxis protein CheW
MNQLLTWMDSGKKFGLPLEECKEVNRDIRITEVPHSKDFISGIVNLRGDTVTVVNLGSLLGYKQELQKEHFITIRLKTIANNIAIRADEIDDIIEVDEASYESAMSQLGEAEARYIKHVVMSKRGLILVLDTESIQNLNV